MKTSRLLTEMAKFGVGDDIDVYKGDIVRLQVSEAGTTRKKLAPDAVTDTLKQTKWEVLVTDEDKQTVTLKKLG